MRDRVGVVEGQAAGRDGGLLRARRPGRAVALFPIGQRAVPCRPWPWPAHVRERAVLLAVADDGPAVVAAGARDVDLVAALRAMLADPQLAGVGMQRRALRVAMAVAPDGGCAPAGGEARVARRRGAVGGDAHHLAVAARQVLREATLVVVLPVAQCDEEMAARGRTPAASRSARCCLTLGNCWKMTVRFCQRPGGELSSARATAVPLRPVAAALGEAQVDAPVGGERRVDRHVQQAACPCVITAGTPLINSSPPSDPRAIGVAQAKLSAALGDEHPAVGQKGQAQGLSRPVMTSTSFRLTGGGRGRVLGRDGGRRVAGGGCVGAGSTAPLPHGAPRAAPPSRAAWSHLACAAAAGALRGAIAATQQPGSTGSQRLGHGTLAGGTSGCTRVCRQGPGAVAAPSYAPKALPYLSAL